VKITVNQVAGLPTLNQNRDFSKKKNLHITLQFCMYILFPSNILYIIASTPSTDYNPLFFWEWEEI